MPKALPISSRQITAIIKGAKAAGYVPILEIHGIKIHLVPTRDVYQIVDTNAELDRELTEWTAKNESLHGERENGWSKGKGGYLIITDPAHPTKQWYDRIGFDPITMGPDEMKRLTDEAEARWRASIPGTPLGKRERRTLSQLVQYGIGVPIPPMKVKDCGPDTEERLKARGYLETRTHKQFPDRIDSYILTEAGRNAWQNL